MKSDWNLIFLALSITQRQGGTFEQRAAVAHPLECKTCAKSQAKWLHQVDVKEGVRSTANDVAGKIMRDVLLACILLFSSKLFNPLFHLLTRSLSCQCCTLRKSLYGHRPGGTITTNVACIEK